MTELELFKIEARRIGVDISEVETPMGIQFTYGNTRDMFKLWCASANREGYKLVPVDPTKEMLEKIETEKEYFFHVSSDYCDLGIPSYTASEIYKTMIGTTP